MKPSNLEGLISYLLLNMTENSLFISDNFTNCYSVSK